MKRLLVVRHSKAGHTDKNLLDDHARTLTEQGIDRCIELTKHIKNKNLYPDMIVSSSAIRAKETAEKITENINKKISIKIEPKLYLASSNEIFDIVSKTEDTFSSVMIVGHNPGLQQFAIELSGSGDKKKYKELKNGFSPSSMAVFNIPVESWEKIETRLGELKDLVAGRLLRKINSNVLGRL